MYSQNKYFERLSYDQKELVILKKGMKLKIPTIEIADSLLAKMARTSIDINIPEFKLRIIEGENTLYTFPIRDGQNRTRFLKEVGRDIDLKTHVGVGVVTKIYKNNYAINPVTNKKFLYTMRDDGKRTMMPLLPWIEPKINGQLLGQLIHPTTNPVTLGKPYSNGCIGVKESDIWRIYYYAPIGTKVTMRYDLSVKSESGDTMVTLKDIYKPKKKQSK